MNNKKRLLSVVAGLSIATFATACSSDDTDKAKDNINDVKDNIKHGAAAVSNAADSVVGELDRSRATDAHGNEADIAVDSAKWDTNVSNDVDYKKLDVDVSLKAKKGSVEAGAFNFAVKDKNGTTIKGYTDVKNSDFLKRGTAQGDNELSGVVSFNVPKDFQPEFVHFYFDKNANTDAKSAKSKITHIDN